MDNIRQCWAFHRDGMRCEHPAGHPGDHAVTKTWRDIECATPGEFTETPMPVRSPEVPSPPLPTAPAPTEPVGQGRCVACNHKHVESCKCGCYEFIG